jgi:hypothetical protein
VSFCFSSTADLTTFSAIFSAMIALPFRSSYDG